MRRDSDQNAIPWRLNFDHRFVGFNFKQRFAFLYRFAFFFPPRQQLPGFLRHFKGRHYHTDSHKFFGGLDGPSVRSGDALPFCAGFHHFHHLLAGGSFILARGGQWTVHGMVVRASYH